MRYSWTSVYAVHGCWFIIFWSQIVDGETWPMLFYCLAITARQLGCRDYPFAWQRLMSMTALTKRRFFSQYRERYNKASKYMVSRTRHAFATLCGATQHEPILLFPEGTTTRASAFQIRVWSSHSNGLMNSCHENSSGNICTQTRPLTNGDALKSWNGWSWAVIHDRNPSLKTKMHRSAVHDRRTRL